MHGLMMDTPLTMARAKFYTLQMVFYAANRRDCWAYVQARAPLDVKQAIWHHEQDELIVDPRGGTDHMTLMSREAVALGVTPQELAVAQPTPLVPGEPATPLTYPAIPAPLPPPPPPLPVAKAMFPVVTRDWPLIVTLPPAPPAPPAPPEAMPW